MSEESRKAARRAQMAQEQENKEKGVSGKWRDGFVPDDARIQELGLGEYRNVADKEGGEVIQKVEVDAAIEKAIAAYGLTRR